MRVVLLAVAIALLPVASTFADQDAVIGSDLGRRIDRELHQATNGVFWGAVLVARGGKVGFAKGCGYADYGTVPITPDTIFELASVGKQVTATAVLKLVQQGKLKLDDTLVRFWKRVPKDKRAVGAWR